MAEESEQERIQRIVDCEAAISRIRAAVRAGTANQEQVAQDLGFIEQTVRPRFVAVARKVANLGPDVFDEALEMLHDVLVQDILSLTYATMETKFGAWLKTRPLRILQQIARKYGRTSVSFTLERLDAMRPGSGGTLGETIADPAASEDLERLVEDIDLAQAIQLLPPEERMVVSLRLGGTDNNGIAQQLGVSAATATRIYQRAVDNLRRRMAADGGNDA
jgi:RNA polymerase sigma factor (sigma-70 family)